MSHVPEILRAPVARYEHTENLCMFHAGLHNLLLNLPCPTGISWVVPGRLWSWTWDGRQPRDKFALPGPPICTAQVRVAAAVAQVMIHVSGT